MQVPISIIVLAIMVGIISFGVTLALMCALSKRSTSEYDLIMAQAETDALKKQKDFYQSIANEFGKRVLLAESENRKLTSQLTTHESHIKAQDQTIAEYERDKELLGAQYHKVSNEYAWFRRIVQDGMPELYQEVINKQASMVGADPRVCPSPHPVIPAHFGEPPAKAKAGIQSHNTSFTLPQEAPCAE